MRRKKMSLGKSKKLFAKTAKRIHPRNNRPVSMRGGYRL